jgi:hypothetical protein
MRDDDDDEPRQVLPYRSSDARRRTPAWVWLLLGFGIGVGFMLLGSWVMWARSVASAKVAVTTAVVQAQSAANSNPLSQVRSLTAEQDAGRVVAGRDSIGVPYEKFVFLSDGVHLVAARITCPSGLGRAIHYEWREIAQGSSQQGIGSAVEKGGSARLSVGPFELVWSQGNQSGGWLYWPSNTDFAVATTVADGTGDFEEALKTTKWRDREGETLDPRELAKKQQKITSK